MGGRSLRQVRLGCAYVVLLAAVASGAALFLRWDRSAVRQGGSFVVEVEGSREQESSGSYLGLYHRGGRARTLKDTWTVLTSGERDLEPLSPSRSSNLRPGRGDELTDMGSSLAVAWIAANRMLGVDVPFTTEQVVSRQQDADLEALGIEAGAPALREGDELTVVMEEDIVDVPTEAGVRLLTSYRALLGQPKITVKEGSRGSSAGLIFALAYADHLTRGDLTAGLTIAATGAVNKVGHVYEIAYLHEKAQAALKAGADVIFVPRSNFEKDAEVLAALVAGRAEIVAVSHVKDAIKWLCARGGSAEGLCP